MRPRFFSQKMAQKLQIIKQSPSGTAATCLNDERGQSDEMPLDQTWHARCREIHPKDVKVRDMVQHLQAWETMWSAPAREEDALDGSVRHQALCKGVGTAHT